MKYFLNVLIFIFSAVATSAESRTGEPNSPGSDIWPNGKTCAVSLSYDDGLPAHYDIVVPTLNKHGIRATFYLSIRHLESFEKWKEISKSGHELGNHSLFHPCRGRDGYETWLAEYYDLRQYTPGRFRDELYVANQFIDLLDGGKPRTYGNNCTNLTIGSGDKEVPMDPILEELFVASRGAISNRPVDPLAPAFTRLGHFSGDGKTFEQIREEIEQARSVGGWIIYMFHGIGSDSHNLYIEENEHQKLIEWLHQERESIWTAPVVDVASYIKKKN